MNTRIVLVAFLAMISAISAVILVLNLSRPAAPAPETVAVVFAARDIAPDLLITAEMLETRQEPKGPGVTDAIHDPAEAIGRVVKHQVDKGDQLQARKLTEKGMMAVVAAVADISPGQPIAREMLRLRWEAKDKVSNDAMARVDDVADRMTLIPISKGEILRARDLAARKKELEERPMPSMAAQVRAGMRGFMIQLPTGSSVVSNLLKPLDRVDVLLTVSGKDSEPLDFLGGMTQTILQDIEVLSTFPTMRDAGVGPRAPMAESQADKPYPYFAMLHVNPRQAEILEFAQTKGSLHLSLRNDRDSDRDEIEAVTLSDLKLPSLSRPEPSSMPTLEIKARTMRGTRLGRDVIYSSPPEG